MTRASCPSCRMRFSRSTAATLVACPFCGGPLDELSARDALGLRLADETKLADRNDAVALAVAAMLRDRDTL